MEQVERQPELPSPKFSFVDLMNAAPHLAATVQRNVAISLTSSNQFGSVDSNFAFLNLFIVVKAFTYDF